jgi:hypothetical protein
MHSSRCEMVHVTYNCIHTHLERKNRGMERGEGHKKEDRKKE